MHSRSRRVPGADGLSLHLLEWPGAGAPLLLCHGFGQSARVWDAFAPDLARRYRVFAYDARGHGDSDRDAKADYSHPSLAEDLECVADHLALEDFALVGHSMGAYASMYFAAKHPGRVARLVLADASPDLRASARLAQSQAPRGEAVFDSVEQYARMLGKLYPGADPALLAQLSGYWLARRDDGRFVLKLDPRVATPSRSHRAPASLVDDPEAWVREESARLWDFLGAIRCPTLVVRGESSPLVPPEAAQRMVSEALRDARLAVIPGAGHAVMLDNTEAFRAALLEFLT